MPKLLRLAALLLLAPFAHAEKLADLGKPAGYVDDYAGVLSKPVQVEIATVCEEVHTKTHAQIFVVTIKSLNGVSIEEFANQLFHQWKIGEAKTDRGVLMLFAINDHKRRIEVGYGLEPILNDAKTGDIGRSMVPQLKVNDFDNALETGLRPIAQAIADDAHVHLDSLDPPELDGPDAISTPPPPDTAPSPRLPWWGVAAICFFALSAVAFIVFVIYKLATNPSSRRYASTDDGFSSSSSSSSSDSSSSSSSDSSSFSGGDGGDSGGGGSSGSW